MALFLVIFALGVTITGSISLNATRVQTRVQFVLNSQAAQFARSGLTEGLNWMRRQNTQPVVALEPVKDMGATPQILDTDDEEIGLTRNFKISGSTWGRYEVWKKWDADTDSSRLPFRQLMEARDVSSMRGHSTAGSAWLLKSIGYAYERRDSSKAFDELPNRVLAQEILEMEVSKISFNLPGQAAISSADGDGVSVPSGTEVFGGGTAAGIFYDSATGAPVVGGTLTGVPALSPSGSFDASPETVFGASEDGLASIADQVVTAAADFPNPVPTGSIIFVDTPIVFDNTLPLTGNGIVYFKQDVQIAAGSSSLFSGILYTKGNLTVAGPAEVRGAVIGINLITLSSSGGLVTVVYDQSVLDALQLEFSSYRITRSMRRTNPR